MKAAPLKTDQSEILWERALRVIPAGTQTFSKGPDQYVKGVAPKFIQRGEGSRIWDVDGNQFIDYGMALGPIILGYSYPAVNEAIKKQLRDGITYTLMHPLEVQLAELLAEIIPCAEMVRFAKNGSDATTAAIRVARAFTGRDRIAYCGYHGWQDWYIGSTSRNLGVPEEIQKLTLRFQYNELDSLKNLLDRYPKEIAAVILEPTNFYPPQDGFLEQVRQACQDYGALLIFDEIITGFRMALGGAQEFFGVVPDLAAFGKAMGNGMPIAALVGRAEVMALFEEAFFSTTFGGEALSLAASIATIYELRKKKALAHIHSLGRKLQEGYNQIVRNLGLEDVTECIGYSCWPEILFRYCGGDRKANRIQTLFQQEVVKRGILTRPGMFPCYSHTQADIDQTLEAFRQSLVVVKQVLDTDQLEESLEGEIIEPVIRSEVQVAPR